MVRLCLASLLPIKTHVQNSISVPRICERHEDLGHALKDIWRHSLWYEDKITSENRLFLKSSCANWKPQSFILWLYNIGYDMLQRSTLSFCLPHLWVLRFIGTTPGIVLNYTSKAAGNKIMNNAGSKQLTDYSYKYYHNSFENDERKEKCKTLPLINK